MQCSIGALYIIILFFEIRNYIKFKFYIIAGRNARHSAEKRPPLSAIRPLRPFCALSFCAFGTVQRTMGRNYQCRTVRQQKTTYYICYLFISI